MPERMARVLIIRTHGARECSESFKKPQNAVF